MRIKVRLFGLLPRYVPDYNYTDGVVVEVQEGTTYRNLATVLRLPAGEVGLFSVAGIIRKPDDIVSDREEVSIFIPLAGG